MRWDLVDGHLEVAIVLVLCRTYREFAFDLRSKDTVFEQVITNISAQLCFFRNFFSNDICSTTQGIFGRGNAFFGINILGSNGFKGLAEGCNIVFRLDPFREGFESLFACRGRARASLGFIGKIEILQFSFLYACLDLCCKFVG